MSKLKVNEIEPRGSSHVKLEDANINSGIINVTGGTNLGTAGTKSVEEFVATIQDATVGSLPALTATGQLIATNYDSGEVGGLPDRVGNLEGQIEGALSGSPAGTYADLDALNADGTADQNSIYVLLDTGEWAYYHVGDTIWKAGAAYLDSTLVNSDFFEMGFTDGAEIKLSVYNSGDEEYDPMDPTHFTSINDAIDYAVKTHYPTYVNDKSFVCFIELQASFEMQEQVLVNDLDLGWIRISSVYSNSTFNRNISAITQGNAIPGEGGEAEITEIVVSFAAASELNDNYIVLQNGDGTTYAFWMNVNSGSSEPSTLEGIDTYVEVAIASADTEAQATTKISNAIDGVVDFSAETSASTTVVVTNADVGAVATAYSGEGNFAITVLTAGESTQYYARFTTASAHTYEVGSNIIIRDHAGTVEEADYNGIFEVLAVDTDWVETSQVYDESKVSSTFGFIVDATPIMIDGDWLIQHGVDDWEFFYQPAFGVARGQLPRIACIFEMVFDSEEPDYSVYLDGFCATDQGKMNFEPYSGIIGAGGTGIYGTRNSMINANDAIASNCGRHGFWAYSGTIINARRAFALNNGQNAERDGIGRIDNSTFVDEISGAGILATRGSIINADAATVTGNYSDNVHSEHGSIISAPALEVFGSIVGLDIYQRYGGMLTNSQSQGDGLHTNHLYIQGEKVPEGKIKELITPVRRTLASGISSNRGSRTWNGEELIFTPSDYHTSVTGIYSGVPLPSYSGAGSRYLFEARFILHYPVHHCTLRFNNSTNTVRMQPVGSPTNFPVEEEIVLRTFSTSTSASLIWVFYLSSREEDGYVLGTPLFTLKALNIIPITGSPLEGLSDQEIHDLLPVNYWDGGPRSLGNNTNGIPVDLSSKRNNNKALSVVNGEHGYHTIGEIDPSKLTADMHISVWDTRNTSIGSSGSNQIRLPITTGPSSQDFRVLWGDNTPIQKITDGANAIHTYAEPGVYEIKVIGPMNGFGFADAGDKLKILEIKAWGKDFVLSSGDEHFYNCRNLRSVPMDVPTNNTLPSSLYRMFRNTKVESVGQLVLWDTSSVTSMHSMFWGSLFNQPIGDWDTSSVTSMHTMFRNSPFNQPIGDWDTSSVTSMHSMFYNSPFNQPIGDWDVSSVISMRDMFRDSSFNQPIGDWDTSSVTDMHTMFFNTPFNQPLTSHLVNGEYLAWDISSLETAHSMFLDNSAFSDENYALTIKDWAEQGGWGTSKNDNLNNNVPAHFGSASLSGDSDAQAARQWLVDNYGWGFRDGDGDTGDYAGLTA